MIKHAPEELRNSLEIGLEAVDQNGKAQEYLSDDLQRNEDIQQRAVKNKHITMEEIRDIINKKDIINLKEIKTDLDDN